MRPIAAYPPFRSAAFPDVPSGAFHSPLASARRMLIHLSGLIPETGTISSPQPRDWTERHNGPPFLDGATTIVAADRRLAVRAALPSGLLAAIAALASWDTGHILAGAVVSALLLAVCVVRTLWWAHGFGSRA